ncbi:hypothetical protein [Sphingobacterium multivorum]|uniref:hypothetical protein n=1 Tax=Sphingobacterium multivorum TaxID=28454 RepID=UPI00345EDA48
MFEGNVAGWEGFVFEAGINLEKSILKAVGKDYEIAGGVTVPIKNTEVLNMLNSAAKGDWVKVYGAGLKNGEKKKCKVR